MIEVCIVLIFLLLQHTVDSRLENGTTDRVVSCARNDLEDMVMAVAGVRVDGTLPEAIHRHRQTSFDDLESLDLRQAMEIDHPVNGRLSVARIEDALTRHRPSLSQLSLQLVHLTLEQIDVVAATLREQLANLVLLLFDQLTNVTLLGLSLSEVVIVAAVRPSLPPHERPNNLTGPEFFLSGANSNSRATLDLLPVLFKQGAQVVSSAVLVLEHRERHAKNFIDNLAVLQHIVQVLENRNRELLVAGFDIVQSLNLTCMIGVEVMFACIPITRSCLKPLAPLCSLTSFAALAILVWQGGEIFRVIKADWHLSLAL